MKRYLAMLGLIGLVLAPAGSGASAQGGKSMKIVGMYVHQHWPFNHPYCARTWTLEDWRGYAGGLKQLGYNTVLIWPMLETMPEPLTPSDRANLEKIGRVIDMLHDELGMRAYICLCPNIRANSAEASKAPFEKRHYFYCEQLVNPGAPAALEALIRWREQLVRPIRKADGFAIIDSDPGGYPGSTNAEFVNLLSAHRKMFDRLRPGIELVYWMHAGWRGWSKMYEVGKISFSTPEEQLDTLSRLKAIDPEPWGIANGLDYARKLGIESKVMSFNYGRIEGEPSFPMTNFGGGPGGTPAYEGARSEAPRGVMGNAQTHCVQLPNTFAFVRGATGQPLTDEDYLHFANDLIPGQGAAILRGWRALPGRDSHEMAASADDLERLAAYHPQAGRLKGLLFGSAERFLTDLVLMLRQRSALEEFVTAVEAGRGIKALFGRFIEAATAWQRRHGYECNWYDPRLHPALRKLNSPAINAVLDATYEVKGPLPPGRTAFEQVRANFAHVETFTPRLLEAMRETLRGMTG